ncbi:MAG: right-handed parallel beta-helix repeat-containing protein, partial [Thermoplasmatales archaeon]|nr:right-handed parallel beta-helix repeat-containing protein [Thermoplasmatales archaeon]
VADEGDTIYVFGGTYNEPLSINKKIKLWGGEGGESIIDYKFDKRYTVEITADHAELLDFTISDSGDHKTSHIGALVCIKSNNVVVQGNRINNTNSWGIYVDSTASGSVVSGNMINNTKRGINVDSSSTNDIFNNNISNCSEYAIQVTSSSNNRLYNNYLSNSGHGMYVQECSNINISNNTVTTINYYGIYLYQSTGIVKNNNIINNEADGIYLSSFNCEIFDNILDANRRGITLVGSNNEIRNNSLSNSSGSGIYAYSGSEGNIIYLNRFVDNGKTVQGGGNNQWFYENQGNYWSDYNNIDRDLDGIGDVPYTVPEGNNQDKYPLGYFLKPPEKPS